MWTENGLGESAIQFPRFEGFFSRCQRSSMSATSTSLPKPALSYQNLIVFSVHSDGFFDDERRNQLFHGIWASRYWNHVKTVGLWAWRNQNVTKTLGFYSGFKRNVWRAKCGLKMVFVSRPGHAASPFWRVCFKVPEVFRGHNFHKPAKTSTIVPKPYNFLVYSDGFFDDERRNQFFHGIWASRYWNHVKTVGLWAWRN